MTRRNLLWAVLLGVPVAVAGSLAYANTQKAGGYTCPLTGENLPCEHCCPLNGAGFTCPVTGEQLPCEKCCPLNGDKPVATAVKADEPKAVADGDYICPLTGEKLDCPNCCPLNKTKK